MFLKNQKLNNKIKWLLLVAVLLLSGWFKAETASALTTGLEYATALELGTRDIRSVIMQVINIAIGFLGVIALIIVLYGGFIYMTSAGDEKKIEQAKKILINGVIGLALVLSSYAIAYFVVNTWLGATGPAGGGSSVVSCGNSLCDGAETCSSCVSDCGICPAGGGVSNFAVSWVDPSNTETNVSLCRLTQVQFNKTIDVETVDNVATPWSGSYTIDSSTSINDVNFRMTVSGGAVAGTSCTTNNQCASGDCNGTSCQGDLVPGEIVSWSNDSTSSSYHKGITFNNKNDYESNTTYLLTIYSGTALSPGLQSTSGEFLSSGATYTSTFTTGNTSDTTPPTVTSFSPSPDGVTNVCRLSPLVATFSEPMNVASLLSTDTSDPMNPAKPNSVYLDDISFAGFEKSVGNGAHTLFAVPKALYTEGQNYHDTWDGDVITDSCDNKLDGNGDGVSSGSTIDDYTRNFTAGATIDCTPKIDNLSVDNGYYNDEITITGSDFSSAGNVIFNNNVSIASNIGVDTSCLNSTSYVPSVGCVNSWVSNEIKIKVPAGSGVSNGAITGDLKVEVGINNVSNASTFTVNSSHINNISPVEGGVDQFITLSGVNFGNTKGVNDHIYFKKKSDPTIRVEATYPCAGSVGWTDTSIVVAVPNDPAFVDGEDWYVQIVLGEGTTNHWSNVSNFIFKNITPGPGICSVLNTGTGLPSGVLDDSVQFSGVRFNGTVQKVLFGNYEYSVTAKNINSWVVGPPDTVNAGVPNILAGPVGTYLTIDGKNSNILTFTIDPTTSGPHIDFFEATSGPVGSYITIHGSGFGQKSGVANVYFSNGAGEVAGDFSFPAVCGNNFWQDNQIIVKVPTTAVDGVIKVVNSGNLADDTSDLAIAIFDVTTAPLGPSICNIEPKSGPVGAMVKIFGERFTGASAVKFFNNKNINSPVVLDGGTRIDVNVPDSSTSSSADDAVSGDVSVIGVIPSNGYSFQVFDCREASNGCASIGFPSLSCCFSGSCETACSAPSQSTYSWNFSTGTYATCSGYSYNQCTTAQSCPNSPGACSPSPAQQDVDTGVDCGKNYCDNTFTTVCSGASCNYVNNSCIKTSACDIKTNATNVVGGLTGVASCNNVNGSTVWQTDLPCQTGTFLDTNGKCTLGSVGVGNQETCSPTCADNFNCRSSADGQSGDCVKDQICPSGSDCTPDIDSDSIDDCTEDIAGQCECCCRVGFSETDCCAGLTCENADCGTDDSVTTYGFCNGCAVWDGTNFYQDLSDQKCGCKSDTKICITNESYLPSDVNFDSGHCGDCESVGGDQTECQSHSACCWDGTAGSCGTCGSLQVLEQECSGAVLVSYPSPFKNKVGTCVNGNILIRFNLDIDGTTLNNGVDVKQCNVGGDFNSSSCNTAVAGTLSLTGDPKIISFDPTTDLVTDTWYQVVIDSDLRSASSDLRLKNDYVWQFKTSSNATVCKPEKIEVLPLSATLTQVGDDQNYSALPLKDCESLDPADYTWTWDSSDLNIATIAPDTAPATAIATAGQKDGITQIKASIPAENISGQSPLTVLLEDLKITNYWPNCDSACRNASIGADLNISIDTATLASNVEFHKVICGNGVVDKGEDCDDGNSVSGDGCSGSCLNEGTLNSSCGNNNVEVGEDCDGELNSFPTGCDITTCLHTGSVLSVAVCGNNIIEGGEDCDDGNATSNDGCSDICLNEGAGALSSNLSISVIYNSLTTNIDISPTSLLEAGETYRSVFKDGLTSFYGKPLTGLNYDLDGDSVNDSFSWTFKVKDNFCNPDVVKLEPKEKTLYSINAIQEYEASVFGSPDECNSSGQKLNAYSYNWDWSSVIESVAIVSNVNIMPSCGNGKIEKGEDCDDGNSLSNDGCSSVCLNEGSVYTDSTAVCKNGIIEKGEDCDGQPFPQACDVNTCLNTGTGGVSICNDGVIGLGEDCDDGNNISSDGCSNVCLNEGTKTDAYTDFIQKATTKSPGTTDIMASVNYCGNNPIKTCDGPSDTTTCTAGSCSQTTGSSALEVVCGYENDTACSKGVCVNPGVSGYCSNNSSITGCTTDANCDLSATTDQTCDVDTADHTCSLEVWGGTCSVSSSTFCYSNSDCPDTETCMPSTDCNYCKNNTSIECQNDNHCNVGVGYDSCCYSRPQIMTKSPEPSYFDPFYINPTTGLINTGALNCSDNATPANGTDDFCEAFDIPVPCQTYVCNDTADTDTLPDTCSAYGKCRYEADTLGLSGYWKLNGNTTDNSNNTNDGTLVGGSWVTGQIGQAVRLPAPVGSNYITVPDNASLNFSASDSFTLQAWFNPDNATTHHRLITKGNPYNIGGTGYSLLYYTSGSYNYMDLQLNDSSTYCQSLSEHLGDVHNKWTQVSVVFDRVKNEIRWYINGKPFGVSAGGCLTSIGSVSTVQPLYLGNAGAYGLEGLIDDVRIYKRALNDSEATNTYQDSYSNIFCLNNNDCPVGTDNSPAVCDKSCTSNAECNDIVCGACRNAQVNIVFDQLMDTNSFNADGVCSNNSAQACSQDSSCTNGTCLKNIRLGVKYDNAAVAKKNCPTGYYAEPSLVYQEPKGFINKIVYKIKQVFNKLLGRQQPEAVASSYWCAIPGTISSFNNDNRTTAVFNPIGLTDNLFDSGLNYQITIKDKVKSQKGVALNQDQQFQFTAGDVQCEVNAVEIYISE